MRIAEVREAHEKTFHWVFDPDVVDFSTWLRHFEPSGLQPIYWIKGKPGSGKSTLMKFAMRDARMSDFLASDGDHDWAIAAFFFHDRGSMKQKSLVGMLQELLLSILQQSPELLRFVIPPFRHLVHLQRSTAPTWDFAALKSAFLAIVEQREISARICLIVDALDEHEGDNELLASLLKTLAEKADQDEVRLKVCLASRPWTIFQQQFGDCPGFAIHEHTRQDILTYVEDRLVNVRETREPLSHRNGPHRLIELVTNRALGVFIWVRLVVDLLSKGLRDGTPLLTLEEQVNGMPQELKDLYADTLRRIEKDYAPEAYIMLQMVVCSLNPLPLDTLMGCLEVSCLLEKIEGPLAPAITLTITEESITSMKSRLVSRSGGLLEVILTSDLEATVFPNDSSPALDAEDRADDRSGLVVQFIHQTVKEYVQSAPKDLALVHVHESLSNENGDFFLLRSCMITGQSWISCVKRDIFAYANCCAKGGMSGSTIFEVLRRALLVKDEPFAIDWVCKQYNGPLMEGLQRFLWLESRDSPLWQTEHDREKAFLLWVAAFGRHEYLLPTLEWYVSIDLSKQGERPRGLIHVAAAGRDVSNSLQRTFFR